MGEEIRIFTITEEQKEDAAKLMIPEMGRALLNGAPVTALAAVCDDVAVGVLAGAVIRKKAFVIRSIYVHPDYRRRGVGRKLIETLSGVLRDMSLEIRADYTLQSEDNRCLEPFLLGIGFRREPFAYPSYCILDLKDSKMGEGAQALGNMRVFSFAEVSERMLRKADLEGEEKHRPLPEGGLLSERILKDYSYCVVSEEGIHAYFTVEKAQENMFHISAVWTELKKGALVRGMITAAIHKLLRDFGEDVRAAVAVNNETGLRVVQMMGSNVMTCSRRFVKEV